MPHTAQSGYRRHIFRSGLSVESLVDIRDPGIGVRVSIYIQAFLILVPGALKFVELIAVYDRVKKNFGSTHRVAQQTLEARS